MKRKFIIGVDLGGTKIATGIMDLNGNIITKNKEFTQQESGPKGVISQMIRMVEENIKNANISLKEIKGIGIGAAGPLNTKKGIIIEPPNLIGWRNVQLVKPFKEKFFIPVYLDNDANAAALGEFYFGAGKGTKNMVYLTISTGIGGGIIIEGKLYHGANDNAGEIGHMTIDPDGPLCRCGNRGCLEAHSSGTSIARYAKEILRSKKIKTSILEAVNNDIEKIDAEIVFKCAKEGDNLAKEIVNKICEFLGIGVANIINIFNPEKVVLGGGVTKAGNILFKIVRKVAKERAMPSLFKVVKIVPAKLKDNVGIIGAGALILEREKN
jgi:glucokinase